MFHGRLKKRLDHDETIKRAYFMLPRFIVEELATRYIGIHTSIASRTNEYKNQDLQVDDAGTASFREGHQLAIDLLMLSTS